MKRKPGNPLDRDEIVWDALGQLQESPTVREAMAFAEQQGRKVARRAAIRRKVASAASPLIVTAAVGMLAVAGFNYAASPHRERIETPLGQRKIVQLEDGSKLIVNTQTRLDLVFGWRERRIELAAGQINIEVAHDASRPFHVVAGPMTVTAIGTNFDVSALPGDRAVTLSRGRVLVEATASGNRNDRVYLQPGEQVALSQSGSLSHPRKVDLSHESAWHDGIIDFGNARASEVIAEANRYLKVKIVLDNPAASSARVNGIFKAGDSRSLVAALCAHLGLRIARQTSREIILEPASAAACSGTAPCSS